VWQPCSGAKFNDHARPRKSRRELVSRVRNGELGTGYPARIGFARTRLKNKKLIRNIYLGEAQGIRERISCEAACS